MKNIIKDSSNKYIFLLTLVNIWDNKLMFVQITGTDYGRFSGTKFNILEPLAIYRQDPKLQVLLSQPLYAPGQTGDPPSRSMES